MHTCALVGTARRRISEKKTRGERLSVFVRRLRNIFGSWGKSADFLADE